MAHVFISYVRENSAIVDRLANALRGHGIEVWLDRWQLRPGRRWQDAIRTAINEGAFFVACFSAEYAARDRTFMNEELTSAIEELRQRAFDQSWFIPVLLNETTVPQRPIGAGETLAALHHVRLFDDWDRGIQQILSVIMPEEEALRELAHPSARARIRAADQLGALGARAWRAVPALVERLGDENETVRAAAAEALGHIGVADSAVVLRLLSITGDDGHPYYPTIKASAALVKLGERAVPALVAAMGLETRERDAACQTLGAIGMPAVRALSGALTSDNWSIRHGAIEALALVGKLEPGVTPSPVPLLIGILRQGERAGGARAAVALGHLGDRTAVPALVDALSDENHLSVCSASALGRIGDPAAVGPLIEVVRDHDKFWYPRSSAVRALGALGPSAVAAVPVLTEALGYPVEGLGEKWDRSCRDDIVEALSRIRAATPSAP